MTRATKLMDEGRYQEAVAAALAQASEVPKAASFGELAYAYLGVGDRERALDAVNRAVQMAPEEPAYRFLRARVEFMLHRPSEAGEDLEQVELLSERFNNFYYVDSARLLAAACRVEVGDSEGAFALLAQLTRAVKVHAGRLLTNAGVAQAARDLKRPRGQLSLS